jgi:hypothetical protein
VIERSLKLGRERVVDRAEVEPLLLDDLGVGSSTLLRRRLSKDHRKPGLEMPVWRTNAKLLMGKASRGDAGRTDVTMEEPRSRVVRLEADNPRSTLNSEHIAARRIDVVGWAVPPLNDVEGVAVETTKKSELVSEASSCHYAYWNGWT